jgi:hypothetical protein
MVIGDEMVTLIVAVGGSWPAVGTLGWWLSTQFRRTDEKAAAALAAHEALDQQRHDDTLRNFGRVYVALARRGIPVVLDGSGMMDPPNGEG